MFSMDSFLELKKWAYENVVSRKADFDFIGKIQILGEAAFEDVLKFRSKFSEIEEVANLDQAIMTYFTFAAHTFLASKTAIEYGFPVMADQSIRTLFEIGVDMYYLQFGEPKEVLEKGERCNEYKNAYIHFFTARVMDREDLIKHERFEDFEKSLSEFKLKYKISENVSKKLSHWSGMDVRRRCEVAGISDHYYRYSWLSQSAHLTPVILERFRRVTAGGYEYLNGQTPQDADRLLRKLGFEYLLIINQLSGWYGLIGIRERLEKFSTEFEKWLSLPESKVGLN